MDIVSVPNGLDKNKLGSCTVDQFGGERNKVSVLKHQIVDPVRRPRAAAEETKAQLLNFKSLALFGGGRDEGSGINYKLPALVLRMGETRARYIIIGPRSADGRPDGSGPHHLFGAETARADLRLYDLASDVDSHGMDIGVPSPFCLVVGVTHVISNDGSLPADITNSTHRLYLLIVEPKICLQN